MDEVGTFNNGTRSSLKRITCRSKNRWDSRNTAFCLTRLRRARLTYESKKSLSQEATMFSTTRRPVLKHVEPVDLKLLEGDKIQPGHPLFGLVWINPKRVSGAPCFYGTR